MRKRTLKQGATIVINGRRWFDRVNGNTYHASDITIIDGAQKIELSVPMTYGYGDHYLHTAMQKVWQTLNPCKAVVASIDTKQFPYTWRMKDFYTFVTSVVDVQRKKDL